ncbi:hypothetical protein [Arthrobacter cheniae]|uniref:hypothetical protein n=1 Tax=Arthrobacter cheniae TaxID=1258888 RepID=UPI0011C4A6C3|nr:hypothetical protein [Arthrobacter cheniae]
MSENTVSNSTRDASIWVVQEAGGVEFREDAAWTGSRFYPGIALVRRPVGPVPATVSLVAHDDALPQPLDRTTALHR